MKQNSHRRRGPQSLPPSPEELEQSPLWQSLRQMGEGIRSMQERGLLPKVTPEMTEKLRQTRESLENSEASRIFREAQERRQREIDDEQREHEEELCRIEERKRAEEGQRRTEEERHHNEERNEHRGSGGRPRIEFPHLKEALDKLGEKWPRARSNSKVLQRHIKFVSDYCRDHGDEVGRIYDDNGKVLDPNLRKTFRRRIVAWKEE
jgi:hypothetical protein